MLPSRKTARHRLKLRHSALGIRPELSRNSVQAMCLPHCTTVFTVAMTAAFERIIAVFAVKR